VTVTLDSWNGRIDCRPEAWYWLCGEAQGMICWNCGMGNDMVVMLCCENLSQVREYDHVLLAESSHS